MSDSAPIFHVCDVFPNIKTGEECIMQKILQSRDSLNTTIQYDDSMRRIFITTVHRIKTKNCRIQDPVMS